MVIMTVYVMMALGLNMVVGYAGLLDLGYVAFFAIGAYCAAWFASPHFARPDIATGLPSIDINFGAVGVFQGIGGIHISIWLVLLIGAAITALAGVAHRAADAAATRRLPRHRHARLRRDGRAGRAQRRRGRPRLQPHERPARDQPDRLAGVRGSWLHDTSACRRIFLTAHGLVRGLRASTCCRRRSSTSCTGAPSRSS